MKKRYYATIKQDGKEIDYFDFYSMSEDMDYLMLLSLNILLERIGIAIRALRIEIDDFLKVLSGRTLEITNYNCDDAIVLISSPLTIIYGTEYDSYRRHYIKRYYGLHKSQKTECFFYKTLNKEDL